MYFLSDSRPIINETVVDTKTIDRMKLVEDITNVNKVTDDDVGDLVRMVRQEMGYKPYWVTATAHKFNNNEQFKYELKILVNKYKAEMIKVATVANNINKLSKDY